MASRVKTTMTTKTKRVWVQRSDMREREHSLARRPEFLFDLPKSDSIWGDLDILNSRESSQATFKRVRQLVDGVGLREGIYLGVRETVFPEKYIPPLKVFDINPGQLRLPFNEVVNAISGPLTRSEAIATGYLVETAAITLIDPTSSLAFEEIEKKLDGKKRLIALGLFTLHDYIARMAYYRNVNGEFAKNGMSEGKDEDLAKVVGLDAVRLAKIFRKDNYRIDKNFQQTIDKFYVGNKSLFIPFADVLGGQPQTEEDWQMIGLGFHTGVRLFRKIQRKQR